MSSPGIPLHRLGWKAFQDLCAALAEESLGRPVQTFLPTSDGGRDGAFLGTWKDSGDGESTIQCKFTSKEDSNLVLSNLADELPKAAALAKRGLASDYVILTNHGVTGASELRIRARFEAAGVGRCRVFHRDWIADKVRSSPKLRMMVPRLYGLGDLADLFDERAYKQAQMILSEMGDGLQRFVVTDAYRRSVRAIGEHRLVLLLGSPAAGKSTIGASLAIGAADRWNVLTVKSTSPEHLQTHLDPDGGQFFWIDDAWGSTQYQRGRTENWNQVFPLMQGAMKKGTRFLITSRDYIWNEARRELKLQAFPVLGKSQVVIDVNELTEQEKARILYNHIKFGDQPSQFRKTIKPLLPGAAARNDFLPETARRLGSSAFTETVLPTKSGIARFFAVPQEFLEQTIEALSAEARAAIALVFLGGAKVRSPVPAEAVARPASNYGVNAARLRAQLEALNGSLLNLVEDEKGQYWTYRHPTVGDAFASHVSKNPESIETYLAGAKPETIAREVVCAGAGVTGARVVVPDNLHGALIQKIGRLERFSLVAFMSQRANAALNKRLLDLRSDVWEQLETVGVPLRDDSGAALTAALHEQGLLPEARRLDFVKQLRRAAVEDADASMIEKPRIGAVLTPLERSRVLARVRTKVLSRAEFHVERVMADWDPDYDPQDHFGPLGRALLLFADAVYGAGRAGRLREQIHLLIERSAELLAERYDPQPPDDTTVVQSPVKADALTDVFRDIDD